MRSHLAARRERIKKRRILLAAELGAMSVEELGKRLGWRVGDVEGSSEKSLGVGPSSSNIAIVSPTPQSREEADQELNEAILERSSGSSAFLKGTASANPHNDYSQHFVDTGKRPQNFIRDSSPRSRFSEHPRLRELFRLKDKKIAETATPPMYMQMDLRAPGALSGLGLQFDVILIEPPMSEGPAGSHSAEVWDWDAIEKLDIPSVAESRSFLWLWAGGDVEGTERARRCLTKWGFRRCEDIAWVKTNKRNPGKGTLEPGALLRRTKEHCIMGIRGTVRRNQDGDFIHANMDLDIILAEEPSLTLGQDPREKPEEIFTIIEHFCLGRRRLHLFGRDDTLRPGWLSLGPEVTGNNFDRARYLSLFREAITTGSSPRIEELRPKSPERSRAPRRGTIKRRGIRR